VEGLGQWGGMIIYLAVFFGIIYFLMIRPQQKQQKQRMQMLNSVKVNDRIVTIGGIHGRITKIKDDIITVRIADKVEIELEKQAIGRVLNNKDNKES